MPEARVHRPLPRRAFSIGWPAATAALALACDFILFILIPGCVVLAGLPSLAAPAPLVRAAGNTRARKVERPLVPATLEDRLAAVLSRPCMRGARVGVSVAALP